MSYPPYTLSISFFCFFFTVVLWFFSLSQLSSQELVYPCCICFLWCTCLADRGYGPALCARIPTPFSVLCHMLLLPRFSSHLFDLLGASLERNFFYLKNPFIVALRRGLMLGYNTQGAYPAGHFKQSRGGAQCTLAIAVAGGSPIQAIPN